MNWIIHKIDSGVARAYGIFICAAMTAAGLAKREPTTHVTPALSPSHPTHVWDGEPVEDRMPFPGAENPLLDVMDRAEWRALERDAVRDHALEGRDV